MNIKSEYNKTKMFFEYAHKMMPTSKMNEDTEITPYNVYQPAYKANRDLLLEIMSQGHLPGSTVLGVENLLKLKELADQGKSCILLSEHFSNMDVPSMFTCFYQHEDDALKEIFEKIVFIAGMKLNETPLVKLYTEMFTRVVIYAARSLDKLSQEEMEEVRLARKINIKATRKIKELRSQGNIFCLYPAGTRYRPWDPDSKKGIKEAMSYLNSFDYFCTLTINGNNMPPDEHESMVDEQFVQDVIVFNCGEPVSTRDYIQEKSANLPAGTDPEDKGAVKQYIVDSIMADLDAQHDKTENEYRKKHIPQ